MNQVVTKVLFSSKDLQEMFFEWLEERRPKLPFSVLQPALAQMDDAVMPADHCRRHGFPVGCSVGHAARSSIFLCRSDGKEYGLNTRIAFSDEEESLEWWRNNKENPGRVVAEPTGDGRFSLRIAPIRSRPK